MNRPGQAVTVCKLVRINATPRTRMPTHPFIICLLVLASLVCGSALAADKPSTQADFEKLQDQVRTLDKELAVQKEAFIRKLDDVEKRQADNTAKDANSLAAISN